MEGFKGYISDIGGPSANMYGMGGRDTSLCSRCTRPSCLHPKPCPNLDNSHARLLALYRRATEIKGVKKAFIGSGIRYDLFDRSDGGAYLREVVVNHTSGRLKVAPEHTEDEVLKLMRKPSFALFRELNAQFNDICRREGLRYQLIPYFISSHPGCTEADMERLSAITRSLDFRLEQVQDLTPTPMTLSSVMFYTESDPYTGRPLYVAKSQDEKRRQKSYFFRNADGTLRSDQLVPRRGKHGQSHPSRPAAPKPDRQNEHPAGKGRDTAQAHPPGLRGVRHGPERPQQRAARTRRPGQVLRSRREKAERPQPVAPLRPPHSSRFPQTAPGRKRSHPPPHDGILRKALRSTGNRAASSRNPKKGPDSNRGIKRRPFFVSLPSNPRDTYG